MKTELRQTSRGGCCVCLCLGFNSTLLNNDPLLQTFVCLSGGGREKRERAPKHGSSGFVRHAFHCLRSIPPNLQHESKALGFPAMPSGLRFSMFSRGSWFEVVNVRSNTPSQVEARRCLPAISSVPGLAAGDAKQYLLYTATFCSPQKCSKSQFVSLPEKSS